MVMFISFFLVFSAMHFIISYSVQILVITKLDLVSSTLVVSSDAFHIMVILF